MSFITNLLLISLLLFSFEMKKKQKKQEFMPISITLENLDQLKNVTAQNNFVIVFFKNSTFNERKQEITFKKTSKMTLVFPLTFATFDVQESDLPSLHEMGIKLFPSYYMFIKSHKKHYVGAYSYETLAVWINEVFEAKPVLKKSKSDIDHIDRHYFVFVPNKLLKSQRKYFNILAKLISPLRIYTGFNKTEIQSHFGVKSFKKFVWVYREYKHEIVNLNITKDIETLSHEIISNEFPSWVECDDHSYKFFVEFKIPVLIYYGSKNDDVIWESLKNIAADYSEYFMPVRVDIEKHGKCEIFTKQFMAVRKGPALRILNMSKNVKRYKFLGDFDAEHFSFFLSNYISGNLKSYKLNQKITKDANVKGVRSGNYEIFKKAVNDYNHRYLFYIYDQFVPSLEADLSVIKAVQSKLTANRSFKIFAIDHLKNDIDNFYTANLPLIFLVLKKGKFVLFEKEKLTKASLLEFLKKNLPNIEIEDEIGGDL